MILLENFPSSSRSVLKLVLKLSNKLSSLLPFTHTSIFHMSTFSKRAAHHLNKHNSFHWLFVSALVRLLHLLPSSVSSCLFVVTKLSFDLSIDHHVFVRSVPFPLAFLSFLLDHPCLGACPADFSTFVAKAQTILHVFDLVLHCFIFC